MIDRCLAGDQKAYYELYKMYSKAMYNICFRILGDKAQAEDALQEAFVSAFQNLGGFEGRASFGAWLKRIVVNTAVSHLKKRRIDFEGIDERMDVLPEEAHGDKDENELILQVGAIREAIRELPAGFRTVFSLYLLEGYDHGEIAEILGISESTSKTQYKRAKMKLKDILKKEYYER